MVTAGETRRAYLEKQVLVATDIHSKPDKTRQMPVESKHLKRNKKQSQRERRKQSKRIMQETNLGIKRASSFSNPSKFKQKEANPG